MPSARQCFLCGIQDHPQIAPEQCNCAGGEILGHSEICAAVEHYVVRDLMELKGSLTPLMQSKGWKLFGVFQGKQAMQRLLCRACIRRQDDVIEIEAYRKKCGEEAEGASEMSMYEILCS